MSGNSRQTCSEAPCDCRFSLTAGSDSHGIVHGAAECGAQALHLNGNLLGESPETQREIRELVRAGMCGTFRGCSAPRHRGSSSSCGRPNAKAPNSETPSKAKRREVLFVSSVKARARPLDEALFLNENKLAASLHVAKAICSCVCGFWMVLAEASWRSIGALASYALLELKACRACCVRCDKQLHHERCSESLSQIRDLHLPLRCCCDRPEVQQARVNMCLACSFLFLMI